MMCLSCCPLKAPASGNSGSGSSSSCPQSNTSSTPSTMNIAPVMGMQSGQQGNMMGTQNPMVGTNAPQMGTQPIQQAPMMGMPVGQQATMMTGAASGQQGNTMGLFPGGGMPPMSMMNPMQAQMWQLQQQLLNMQRGYNMASNTVANVNQVFSFN